MEHMQSAVNKNYLLPQKAEKRKIFSANEIGRAAKCWSGENPAFLLLPEGTSVAEVIQIYADFPDLDFLPVINAAGRISGYAKKKELHAILSQSQYSRDLMLRPEMKIEAVMEKRIICIPDYYNLSEASRILMDRDEEIRFDPFVILSEESILGISNVKSVMDNLNQYMKQDLKSIAATQNRLSGDNISFPNLHITRYLEQLNEGVGGDYADAIQLNQDTCLACHFDVVGKGIKAFGMVMAIASIFKSLPVFNKNLRHADSKYSFSGLLETVNRLLYDITPQEMYAAGSVIVIDSKNMILKIYDFGQDFVWLKRGNKIHHLSNPAEYRNEIPYIGINQDFIAQRNLYRIKKGDVIFSASDGIIELKNKNKQEYGVDKLVDLIQTHDYEEIQPALHASMDSHRDGYRKTDDISYLIIKI